MLVFVTSITAVSAFDLGDLFGGAQAEENKTVTIEGMKFNVPAGFEEDPTNTTNEVVAKIHDLGINATAKSYVNDTAAFAVLVGNYTSTGLTFDDIQVLVKENPTTIKNINGSLTVDNGVNLFTYEKNGEIIMISAPTKEFISNVIIA